MTCGIRIIQSYLLLQTTLLSPLALQTSAQHESSSASSPSERSILNQEGKSNNAKKNAKRRHTHKHVYPPKQEEYDPFIFDKHTMYGSPYGGFSRATRSRIASIPLRLVGGAGFDLMDSFGGSGDAGFGMGMGMGMDVIGETYGKEGGEGRVSGVDESNACLTGSGTCKRRDLVDGQAEIEEGTGLDRSSKHGIDQNPSSSTTSSLPYFTMRDGDGRKFACRVYYEEELTAKSITGSVFDAPIEWGSDDDDDDDDEFTDRIFHKLYNRKEEDHVPESGLKKQEVDETLMKSDSYLKKAKDFIRRRDDARQGKEQQQQNDKPNEKKDQRWIMNFDDAVKLHKEEEQSQWQEQAYDDGQPELPSSSNEDASSNGKGIQKSSSKSGSKSEEYFPPKESATTEPEPELKEGKKLLKQKPIVTHSEISKQLAKLNGKCSQIHLGWWSYEWCHESDVTQFHVEQMFTNSDKSSGSAVAKAKNVVEAAARAVAAATGSTAETSSSSSTTTGRSDLEYKISEVAYTVSDITKIGSWSKRRILVTSVGPGAGAGAGNSNKGFGDGRSGAPGENTDSAAVVGVAANTGRFNKDESGTKGKIFSGFFRVRDTYSNGDWCPAAGRYRTMDVDLRCCHEDELGKIFNFKKNGSDDQNVDGSTVTSSTGTVTEKDEKMIGTSVGNGDKSDKSNTKAPWENMKGPYALLLEVIESKTEICKYSATICTNVLCADAFDNASNNNENGFNNELKKADRIGDEATRKSASVGAEVISSNHKVTRGAVPKPNPSKTPLKFKKNESIRHILKAVLGETCLEKNDGYWSYRFCHRDHISQFHQNIIMNTSSGSVKKTTEMEHILGIYDKTAELFSKEEEINHLVRPRGSDGNASSGDGILGKKGKKNRNASVYTGNASGGNGVYYVEHYHHGDVCDQEDVIDSVIKGGNILTGVIERSATIRYSCGKDLELAKINEDSTCHYELDVTVPELCKHEYFEAPLVKTQVVKCLPLD